MILYDISQKFQQPGDNGSIASILKESGETETEKKEKGIKQIKSLNFAKIVRFPFEVFVSITYSSKYCQHPGPQLTGTIARTPSNLWMSYKKPIVNIILSCFNNANFSVHHSLKYQTSS